MPALPCSALPSLPCSDCPACSLCCCKPYNGSGGTREQSGRCISNLVLDTNSQQQLPQPPTDNQQGQVLRHKWIYTFGRASQAADVCVTSQAGLRPMNECGFAEGDMMVLSIEGKPYPALLISNSLLDRQCFDLLICIVWFMNGQACGCVCLTCEMSQQLSHELRTAGCKLAVSY